MQLLDGKKLAQEIEEEIKQTLKQLTKDKESFCLQPSLAVLLVGDDPASQTYVNMKRKACERIGMVSRLYTFSSKIHEEELLRAIDGLNRDESVHGILVQLPLPEQIRTSVVLESISPLKDVDGFHPYNIGKISANLPAFAPATPLGVMELLNAYQIPLQGANVTIVGASNIVGKPLAALMLNANATINVCHIHTRDLIAHTASADILCVGIGKPRFIQPQHVKEGAVVIDIGINRLESGALVGDIDFESVAPKCSYITPVPGGVGPMTIASLLRNTLKAFQAQSTSIQ